MNDLMMIRKQGNLFALTFFMDFFLKKKTYFKGDLLGVVSYDLFYGRNHTTQFLPFRVLIDSIWTPFGPSGTSGRVEIWIFKGNG